MINVKIVIIYAFKSKLYQYFVFTKKILQRFVSFCISLIFTYCLFVDKKLATIKMAISAYILKIEEKDPFLRLQIRAIAKEDFNRLQLFNF